MTQDPPTSPNTEPARRSQSHANEQFTLFVRNSVGFVASIIAAIPLLTDYLKSPAEANRGLSLLTTAISALLFLALFWTRHRLERPGVVVVGVVSMFAGAIMLWLRGESPSITGEALLYLIGFPVLLGGAALIFIYGFTTNEERPQTLVEFAPRLAPEDWERLLDIARTQLERSASIQRMKIPDHSRGALQRSEGRVLTEYAQALKNFSRGTIEVHGPLVDEVFEYFVAGVQDSFRTLTSEGLEFWASDQNNPYLSIHGDLLRRRCTIQRTFVVPKSKPWSVEQLDSVAQQIQGGVLVRIVFLEAVKQFSELNFSIFDSFAVSCWSMSYGGIFRIETAPNECEKFIHIYESVCKRAQPVPGQQSGDTVFRTRKQLVEWHNFSFHTNYSVDSS